MKPFTVRLAFGIVCSFISVLFLAACSSSSILITPRPTVYWGVYLDGVPWNMPKLQTFEASVHKKVSIVHWGQPWWHCNQQCGYQRFNSQREQFEAVRLHGAIPLLDWGSWDYSAQPIAQQPQFTLRSIVSGEHDGFLREWAMQAREWGHPFFLRFDWEMNGKWYPWSEVKNGNQVGEFVAAWRHVHDIFDKAGATNVTWVWCVSVEYPNGLPLQTLYPGDAYVDWVAIDGFNWAFDRGVPWRSLRTVFEPTYDSMSRIAPNKPIMIAEVGSTENDSSANAAESKAAWIQEALLQTLPNAFPKVKALVWFDWYAPAEGYHWEIDSSPQSLTAFAQAIGSPYYIENVLSALPAKRIQPFNAPSLSAERAVSK